MMPIQMKPTQPRRLGVLRMAVVVSLLAAGWSHAQRVAVRAPQGAFYVGESQTINVVATGFDRNSSPRIDYGDLPEGLQFELLGMSPQVSQSITSINGRTTRKILVSHVFQFVVSATRAGRYEVGPFRIEHDGETAVGGSVTFEFRDIETDPDMLVAIEMPAGPYYEGQEVPIEIQWGYAGGLGRVSSLEIRSPLFDAFEFKDEPLRRNDRTLPILAKGGNLNLLAKYYQRRIDGREFVVVVAKRTLLAEQPGAFSFPGITALIRKGDRRIGDVFDEFGFGFGGRRQRARPVPLFASGEPLSFEILPLPTDGRPDSFTGAIGDDFELDIQANRSDIRVGDPITLLVTVKGNGNLEKTGLPRLTGESGLPTPRFRLSEEEAAGQFREGRKQFNVAVRVENEEVTEIPAIEFSWFDPDEKRYVKTYSDPIPLNVKPAQIVSSADVVSNQSPVAPLEQDTDKARDARPNGQAVVTTADYAIETDLAKLTASRGSSLGSRMLAPAIYLLGIASVAFAVMENRRRQEDPSVAARRRVFQEASSVVQQSGRRPAREAAEEIAVAFRRVLPEASESLRSQIESYLAELENLIYQPGGVPTGTLDERLIRTAQDLVNLMKQEAAS